MTSDRFWLWSWLDEHSIRSVEAAEKALATRSGLNRLQESAADWEPLVHDAVDGVAILAGAGLDVSGSLDCPNPECQKLEVDKLFRHVWHYFDRIVIQDTITHDLAHHWGEASLREELMRKIEVLLYVRDIGAEALVDFREKGLNTPDWHQDLIQANLGHLTRGYKHAVGWFEKETVVQITPCSNGESEVTVDHPEGGISHSIRIPADKAKTMTAEAIRRSVVESVCDIYASYLASDISTAHHLHVPLGSSLPFHRELLSRSGQTQAEAVAFHLSLPVLDHVPISTLLKLRRDEAEHFKRFQTRLRLAMEERRRMAPAGTPEQIAKEIEQDLIEPELRNIRQRLVASERLLAKKASVGVFLGGLATTCGLLVGAGPIGALAAGVAVIAPAVYKAAGEHMEERRDTSLEDVYFLWKAVGHAR